MSRIRRGSHVNRRSHGRARRDERHSGRSGDPQRVLQVGEALLVQVVAEQRVERAAGELVELLVALGLRGELRGRHVKLLETQVEP